MSPIQSISKTQIGSYLRCPFAYHCRYILGLKIPPTASMMLGNCFDFCINVDYEAKIKSGKDEPVSVVTDAFAEHFDAEKGNAVFGEDEQPDKLKDVSIPAVKEFHAKVCSCVMPAQVQLKDEVTFANVGYSLKVVIDTIDTDGVIIDNKFARRSFGDVSNRLDAGIYSVWYAARNGTPPVGFSYDVAIATKVPKAERFPVAVNQQTIDTTLRKVGIIKDSIDHDTARGVFFPNTSAMTCSRRYCGYWGECEKFWKHTIKP